MEHLLLSLGFTGRVSVVMQNGRVLKSGYEEGYFHQREGAGVDDESHAENCRGGGIWRRASVGRAGGGDFLATHYN